MQKENEIDAENRIIYVTDHIVEANENRRSEKTSQLSQSPYS
jgi:hypothetical protein